MLVIFPSESLEVLKGIEYWIIDCMRYHWAPTHSYLEKTLDWIAKIKPKQAILTHMAHNIEYNELKNMLPDNIRPAYDGLLIEC